MIVQEKKDDKTTTVAIQAPKFRPAKGGSSSSTSLQLRGFFYPFDSNSHNRSFKIGSPFVCSNDKETRLRVNVETLDSQKVLLCLPPTTGTMASRKVSNRERQTLPELGPRSRHVSTSLEQRLYLWNTRHQILIDAREGRYVLNESKKKNRRRGLGEFALINSPRENI